MASAGEEATVPTELDVVRQNRIREARKAGLTEIEAALFAESDGDVGQLRRLVKARCPVDLIRAIVL